MKREMIALTKLEADDGKVFDYNFGMDATEEEIEERGHLYAKTIFLGDGDSADNYIEIDESEMIIPPEEEEIQEEE